MKLDNNLKLVVTGLGLTALGYALFFAYPGFLSVILVTVGYGTVVAGIGESIHAKWNISYLWIAIACLLASYWWQFLGLMSLYFFSARFWQQYDEASAKVKKRS